MFKGLQGISGPKFRTERRLATIVAATNKNPSQKLTHRISKEILEKQTLLRIKEEKKLIDKKRKKQYVEDSVKKYKKLNNNNNNNYLTNKEIEKIRLQQEEALAEDDARVKSFRKDQYLNKNNNYYSTSSSSSSSQHLNYDSVNSVSGNSIIQEHFDNLVYEAILKYGPPLPAEFVDENDIVIPFNIKDKSYTSSSNLSNEKDTSCYFYDEVQIKPHELFQMIRKVDPSFSVKTHADSVPFSLLIKNCLYLKVFGGKINFMRCLRRVSSSKSYNNNNNNNNNKQKEIIASLAKYKMRECPSFDGIRLGPQPWLYGYRMI